MARLVDDAFLQLLYDVAVSRASKEKASVKHPLRDPHVLEAGFHHLFTRSDYRIGLNGGLLYGEGKIDGEGFLVSKAFVGKTLHGRPGVAHYQVEQTVPGVAHLQKILEVDVVSRQNLDALRMTAENLLEMSVRGAFEEYYELIADSFRSNSVGFDYLPRRTRRHTHSIPAIPTKYINPDNANKLVARVSRFLKEQPGVVDAVARVDVTSDTMRLVSSEDVAIKEFFPGIRFGFQVVLEAECERTEGSRRTRRVYKLEDALYTTDLSSFDTMNGSFSKRVVHAVEVFAQQASGLVRRKECPDVVCEPDAVVWTDAGGLATLVHEAFCGHSLCADLLLDEHYHPWTLNRFGSLVTDPRISITSMPGLVDKDGLYYPSSYDFDWEGIAPVKKKLITRGRLTDVLANRSTAYRATRALRELGYDHTVLPGDARTGEFKRDNFLVPSTRTSTTSVVFHGPKPRNSQQMKQRFLEELEVSGKEYGYYVLDSMGGQVEQDGRLQAHFPFAYKVFRDGSEQQVAGLSLLGFSDQLFSGLVVMGGKRRFHPHRCGLSGEESDPTRVDMSHTDSSIVRAGMFVQDAIFSGVAIRPFFPGNGYVLR